MRARAVRILERCAPFAPLVFWWAFVLVVLAFHVPTRLPYPFDVRVSLALSVAFITSGALTVVAALVREARLARDRRGRLVTLGRVLAMLVAGGVLVRVLSRYDTSISGAVAVLVIVVAASTKWPRAAHGFALVGAVALATSVLTTLQGMGRYSNCFGPITPSILAAYPYVAHLPWLSAAALGVGLIAARLASSAGNAIERRLFACTSVLLVALGILCAIDSVAALAVLREVADPSWFDVFDTLEVLVEVAAAIVLVVVLLRRDARRGAWRMPRGRALPFVGIALAAFALVSGPLLTVSSVQENADPIWREVPGFSPMVLDDERLDHAFFYVGWGYTVGAVRPRGGPTTGFFRRGKRVLTEGTRLPRGRTFYSSGPEVMLAEDATAADVIAVLHQASASGSVCFVGTASPLASLSHRAMARFPLAERVGRSLREQCIGIHLDAPTVFEPPPCGGRATWTRAGALTIAATCANPSPIELVSGPADAPAKALLASMVMRHMWWRRPEPPTAEIIALDQPRASRETFTLFRIARSAPIADVILLIGVVLAAVRALRSRERGPVHGRVRLGRLRRALTRRFVVAWAVLVVFVVVRAVTM